MGNPSAPLQRLLLLLLLLLPAGSFFGFSLCNAFTAVEPTKRKGLVFTRKAVRPLFLADKTTTESAVAEVVLFGVGDLRTDDHGGLQAALMSSSSNPVVPLVVLDPQAMLRIPGARSHPMDTAHLVAEAIRDLQSSLRTNLGLELSVATQPLPHVLQQLSLSFHNDKQQQQQALINVYVCDLDHVDQAMGYGPYAQILQSNDQYAAMMEKNIRILPWTCHLREEPWKAQQGGTMTDSYPEYAKQYVATNQNPILPIDATTMTTATENDNVSLGPLFGNTIPSGEELANLLVDALSQEQPQNDSDDCWRQNNKNSGLFGTHWGGLSSSSVGGSRVLQALEDYTKDCQEDDGLWSEHPRHVGMLQGCVRNPASLEHAAVAWMLRGKNEKKTPYHENVLDGESMTRYLAAPLLLGTVSPRRLWHASHQNTSRPRFLYTSNLKTMAEGREWHKLLAARNMKQDDDDGFEFGYWRWHGFLCRYTKKKSNNNNNNNNNNKNGLLLVHGFGASGAQWKRTLSEMDDKGSSSLAPDLIGFGEAEKPPLTYTQYLWQNYITDFAKEIGMGQEKWDTYMVGGNSIGGFTSMSVAADDQQQAPSSSSSSLLLTGSGAPGTGRCQGLILMNSAGQIQTRDQIQQMLQQQQQEAVGLATTASLTSSDALPMACDPFPRPLARLLGNGLLWYLRPQIGPILTKLYPTNPDNADDGLATAILRDSLDPGAINVMISGSKLPPPRTANELLAADYGSCHDSSGPGEQQKESVFEGPVLVAQGMLDPLNDATTRARNLGDLRLGITVTPINGGHCPHDELPKDMAKAITDWMTQQQQQEQQDSNNAAVEFQTIGNASSSS